MEFDLINDWNEALYNKIAKKSCSKQAQEDVKYFRWLVYHRANYQILNFRLDETAIILAGMSKKSVRIVVVAVDKEKQGQGIASKLLKYVEILGQKNGCSKIYTITKDGKEFYQKTDIQLLKGVKTDGRWKNTYDLFKSKMDRRNCRLHTPSDL